MALKSVDLRTYTRIGDSADRKILLFGDDTSAYRSHVVNDSDERLYKTEETGYYEEIRTNFQFTLKSYHDDVGASVPWALSNANTNPFLWYKTVPGAEISIFLLLSGRENDNGSADGADGLPATYGFGADSLPLNTLYLVSVNGVGSADVQMTTISTETSEYHVSISRTDGGSSVTTCELFHDVARTDSHSVLQVSNGVITDFKYHTAASSWNDGSAERNRWLMWDQQRNDF